MHLQAWTLVMQQIIFNFSILNSQKCTIYIKQTNHFWRNMMQCWKAAGNQQYMHVYIRYRLAAECGRSANDVSNLNALYYDAVNSKAMWICGWLPTVSCLCERLQALVSCCLLDCSRETIVNVLHARQHVYIHSIIFYKRPWVCSESLWNSYHT